MAKFIDLNLSSPFLNFFTLKFHNFLNFNIQLIQRVHYVTGCNIPSPVLCMTYGYVRCTDIVSNHVISFSFHALILDRHNLCISYFLTSKMVSYLL